MDVNMNDSYHFDHFDHFDGTKMHKCNYGNCNSYTTGNMNYCFMHTCPYCVKSKGVFNEDCGNHELDLPMCKYKDMYGNCLIVAQYGFDYCRWHMCENCGQLKHGDTECQNPKNIPFKMIID